MCPDWYKIRGAVYTNYAGIKNDSLIFMLSLYILTGHHPGWKSDVPSLFRRYMPPRIHDITTDTENPPALTAAARQRTKIHNPVQYEGIRVARIQRQAFPDIEPIQSSLEPVQAYTRARQLIKRFGWQILNEDQNAGILEAVAVTRLFRFRDDVVVRITKQNIGSRIDIRSASRLGVSDFGTNARRIRAFIHAFNAEL